MPTLLEKAIRGQLVEADKASLSDIVTCMTTWPTGTEIENKNKSFRVIYGIDLSKLMIGYNTPYEVSRSSAAYAVMNSIASIIYRGDKTKVFKGNFIDIHSAPESTSKRGHIVVEYPCTTEIEYEGYSTIEEPVYEVVKYQVPTGEIDADGKPVFIEKEQTVTSQISKRIPAKKKKTVINGDFFKKELPDIVNGTISAAIDKLWETLSSLNSAKMFGSPSREAIELESIETINMWSDKLNGIEMSISDKSWANMGFDLAVMANDKDLPVSENLTLSGFTPFFNDKNVKETYFKFFSTDLYVCQLTGKVMEASNTGGEFLYGKFQHYVHFDVLKKIESFLRKVKYMTYQGNVDNTTSVLISDKRGYTFNSQSKLTKACYGYTLDDLGFLKLVNTFLLSAGYAFPMGVKYKVDDISNMYHISLSDVLRRAKLQEIDMPMLGSSKSVLVNIDGTITIQQGYSLPSPKNYLPKPVMGRGIDGLHFPSGWEPPKCFGFKRDTHPVASTAPKPGYRYYGMEIEIENPDRKATSDHVTGFLAHNIIKKGFSYGTDGSLQNGLEFRSSPQGFKSLSENLRGFFDILNTPLPSDFKAIGSSSIPKVSENPTVVWNSEEQRWVEPEAKGDNKPKNLLDNLWRTSSRCGLHIHVSRDSLTELQLGKVLAFVYSKDNRDFMTQIAGRTNDRYAEMTSKPPFEVTKDGKIKAVKGAGTRMKITKDFIDPKTGKVLKSFPITRFHRSIDDPNGRDDKYTAVNTLHAHTIEFRIFKGVETANEAITKLQFVDSLMEFTSSNTSNPVSLSDCLSKDKYVKWLMGDAGNHKKYSLLIEYINKFDASTVKASTTPKHLETMQRRIDSKKELMALFS